MWICRICDHQASRHGNIIRHLKLVHSIDDRDGKNAYRETGEAITSNCKDGRVQTSMDSNEFEQPTFEDGLQSNMTGSGKPLSEHMSDLKMKDIRLEPNQEGENMMILKNKIPKMKNVIKIYPIQNLREKELTKFMEI